MYVNDEGLPVLRAGVAGVADQIVSRRVAIMLLVGTLCESEEEQLDVYSRIMQANREDSQKVLASARMAYEHILTKTSPDQGQEALSCKAIEQLLGRIIADASKNTRVRPVRMYAPRSVTWIPTFQCSNHCIYCYLAGCRPGGPAGGPPSTMPLGRLYGLFDEAARLGVRHVTITGGEPLEYEHINQVIHRIKHLGMRISLTTKQCISRALVGMFSHDDIVGVSLDSYDPPVVAEMTGNATAFRAMNDSLKNMAHATCKKCVEMVVTRVNYLHVLDTVAHAGLFRTDEMHILRVMRSRYRDFNGILLTDREWQTVCDAVRERYPDLRHEKMAITLMPANVCGADPAAWEQEIKYTDVNAQPLTCFTCPKLDRDVVFDSSGRVYACYRIPEMVIGSLVHTSIRDMWQGQALRELSFPTRTMYQGTRCQECEYFDECADKNRCIYYSLLAYGRCFAPDPCACCRKRACFARDYVPFMNPAKDSTGPAKGRNGVTGMSP